MKWKCEIEYRRKRYELVEGVHCKKCDLCRACGNGLSQKITRFCLMEDIAAELGIENDAKPIPLEKQMEAVHELSDEAGKSGKETK